MKKNISFLLKKRESTELKYFNDPKVFIEYLNDMQDVDKNIEEYNIGRKRKILTVFDDMIADMINDKKLNPMVTELSIRGRKLNIPITFITQSHFKSQKMYIFIMKFPNKRKLQQTALNYSSYIDFKDFIKIYKKCTAEPYSYLINDTTLPSEIILQDLEKIF